MTVIYISMDTSTLQNGSTYWDFQGGNRPEKELPAVHNCCCRPQCGFTHSTFVQYFPALPVAHSTSREQTCIHFHWPASTYPQLISSRTGLSGSANSQHSSVCPGAQLSLQQHLSF